MEERLPGWTLRSTEEKGVTRGRESSPERDDQTAAFIYGGCFAAGTEPVLDVDERGVGGVFCHGGVRPA